LGAQGIGKQEGVPASFQTADHPKYSISALSVGTHVLVSGVPLEGLFIRTVFEFPESKIHVDGPVSKAIIIPGSGLDENLMRLAGM
jgi:hypothetical protein